MGTSPIKSLHSQRFCSFLLIALLALVLNDLAGSKASSATDVAIGESELVTILRATKVLPADSKLTASIAGDEVVITTTKKEGATDAASKIEAVLIAKTVFDSVSNDAQRTKVIFFDFKANTYSEVAVKRAEVKMFGSGQLTEKELLSSLELKTGDAESAQDETVKVAPGPLQADRIILKARLMKLEKEGSSVKDLKQILDQLELTARTGNKAETINQYRTLKTNIDEREKAFDEAKLYQKNFAAQLARGGGSVNDTASSDVGRNVNALRTLLVGPKGEKLYSFDPKDLPKRGDPDHLVITYYLKAIHENVNQGKNVQASIASMNGAIHAFNTNDKNQYQNCLQQLHAQLGFINDSFSKGGQFPKFHLPPPQR